VRASIVIQGSDQASPNDETGSRLARLLAGHDVDDDAQAYDLVLPEVERVITRTGEYETLWREPWEKIASAIESFEGGRSKVTEYSTAQVSLINLAPEIFSPSGFNPTRHAAPYTAISRYARGRIFVIATPAGDGWSYRVDYPYYSWAETIVRPKIQRLDLTSFIERLNELDDRSRGSWKLDSREMTSAVKFVGADNLLGVSRIDPETVAANLCEVALSEQTTEATASAL
jgi:hypothetical protein